MGLRAALSSVVVLFAVPAWAEFDAASYPPYERCALCHGLFGVSAMARFPHLGGQDPVYLEAQIRAFLSGGRQNDGGQMVQIVTELTEEDIPVVVEWFASQEPPEPVSGEDTEAGKSLYQAENCADCHEDLSLAPGTPHLTSQHAGYLAKQMSDFRDGRRATGGSALQHGPLMTASDNDIAAIAAYLSSVARP
ncbi:c-type cytochrome [Silicimonas sp. MF1-12-2]|uniref:c-type cytochrome n=1 Tax=Silicimonas sp. MF1-12-2 TaxID=3384793 RepID=UPI0039B4AD73